MLRGKSRYRKSVPKSLKNLLWDTTFGEESGVGKCYVCEKKINSKNFEAGHVKSVHHGGDTNLFNLRCICSTCNKSMGTRNLYEFKRLYFPHHCQELSDIMKKLKLEESEKPEINEEEKKLYMKILELNHYRYKPPKS